MILLAEFSPIKPDFGLLFWTTIAFGLFWLLMSRFAFGPIRDALKKRESDIQGALNEAKQAREEMSQLKAENDKILAQAREERMKILREAKEAKDSIVSEAKEKAKEEAQRIISNAKSEIENQKNAALVEVKNQAGTLALEIAERVIRKQLKGDIEQEQFANSLIEEINLG